MESAETKALILKFEGSHSEGLRAVGDFSRKIYTRRFLARARVALRSLYGMEAQVAQKYYTAFRNARDLTEDEFTVLFREFEHILNTLELMSDQERTNQRSHASPPPLVAKVFVIHGHDEVNSLRLGRLLQNHFGLDPILMNRTPGMGRSLLDKYEDVASKCALAFALMTPDDEIVNQQSHYYQSRPNVIFEVGWFVGRLGIPRVCLLLKRGTVVHSDIDGISRIHFVENIEEKVLDIEKELEVVGLETVQYLNLFILLRNYGPSRKSNSKCT